MCVFQRFSFVQALVNGLFRVARLHYFNDRLLDMIIIDYTRTMTRVTLMCTPNTDNRSYNPHQGMFTF